MTHIFDWIIILFVAWDLLGTGWSSILGLWISLGAKNRRPTDASSLLAAPPPATRQNIEKLFALGFTRIGEAQVKLPARKPVTAWVLADAEGTVQAEAAWDRVSFSSFFQEKVLLVTDCPTGEHIGQPDYQSHTVTTGVEDAYRYHLGQLAKFRQQYGIPHPIRSMGDYLQWETMGRVHYGLRKMQRFLWRDGLRLAVFLYGILVIAVSPLLMSLLASLWKPVFDSPLTREGMLLVVVALILPALMFTKLVDFLLMAGTRRNSPGR